MFKWWAYLHQNNKVLVKRYWNSGDLFEACMSPFVKAMHGPYDAANADEAQRIANEHFKSFNDGGGGTGGSLNEA